MMGPMNGETIVPAGAGAAKGASCEPEGLTKESFEREVLAHLREERLRRPKMGSQDAVKFVFQALLGVGHLLAAREAVTDRIAREMDGEEADTAELLCEKLSPCWCRLNLRRAKAEQIPPDAIAGLMLASRPAMRFMRKDVLEVIERTGQWLGDAVPDGLAPASVLDESWLPSHSDAYRKAYRPAYRVISSDWLPYIGAVGEISRALRDKGRLLVTIDGPCASGKTTFAQRLSEVFVAPVVHTDDFVVPHAGKTPERLAIPGGNCDAERLVNEAAEPWARGETVRIRKYDCGSDRFLPEETLPDSTVLIIEGCYCNLPALSRYAGVKLFVDAPWEQREQRLMNRESPASMKMFYERWIPLENAYFRAYGLPGEGIDLIVPQQSV